MAFRCRSRSVLGALVCALFVSLVACGGGGDDDAADAAVTDAAVVDGAVRDAARVVDATACTLVRPYSSSNATCNSCAQRECCSEINSCLNSTDCDDGYVNCIIACAITPDDAGTTCMDACAAQYPRGKLEYEAATGCAESRCNTECQ